MVNEKTGCSSRLLDASTRPFRCPVLLRHGLITPLLQQPNVSVKRPQVTIHRSNNRARRHGDGPLFTPFRIPTRFLLFCFEHCSDCPARLPHTSLSRALFHERPEQLRSSDKSGHWVVRPGQRPVHLTLLDQAVERLNRCSEDTPRLLVTWPGLSRRHCTSRLSH